MLGRTRWGTVATSFVFGWSLCLAVMPPSASVAQPAESAAEFYKGKTVKIIVGFGVGGGYDIYARMLVPYLRSALNANVIVENQPGAGGTAAINRLYIAPPDGLQMMLISGMAATMGQVAAQPGVRYDLSKFSHIGIVSSSPWLWLGSPHSQTVRTPVDALKPGVTLTWGASGQFGGTADGAALACGTLKLKCRIIGAYKSTNEVALAIERNEVDSLYVSDTSANLYTMSGQTRPITTMARKRSAFFPNVPTIFEAMKLTREQEFWIDFRATVDSLGRVMIAPPGLPKDRLAYLQEALRDVANDPKLIAEAQKFQRELDYRNPADTSTMIDHVINGVNPEKRKELLSMIEAGK